MSRRARVLWWCAGGSAAVCLMAALTGVAVVRSAWFREKVRERILSEVERGTGGRARIGSFRFDWHTMTAEVAPFVVHGTEPANARPLFRADSVRVGLKIVSIIERDIDIRSLTVEKPELTVVVHPDGSTNLPQPRIPRRTGTFAEQVLKLAIRRVALNDGFVEYNAQRFPLQLQGEHLVTTLVYDSRGPQYRGDVSFSPVNLNGGPAHDLTFDVAASIAMDKNGLRIVQGSMRMPRTNVTVSGAMLNWASPVGDFAVRANIAVTDVCRPLRLNVSHRGDVDFNGSLHFTAARFRLAGRAIGRGVDLGTPAFRMESASFSANAEITDSRFDLTGLAVSALGGSFQGRVTVDHWKTFRADGQARGVSIRQLAQAQTLRVPPWDGTLAGPLRASGVFTAQGVRDVVAEAALEIAPAATGPGASGHIDVNYDQRAGALRLGQSQFATGRSQVTLEGTLGQALNLNVETRNLDDLLPLFDFAGVKRPESIPVSLANGSSGRLTATVQGALPDPTVRGHVQLGQFEFAKQNFNGLAANFQLTRSRLDVRDLTVAHEQMQLTGNGRLGLEDWRLSDSSDVAGAFSLRNGDLARLVVEAGRTWPASGSVSGSLTIAGTYGKPLVQARARVTNVTAWREQFASAQADLRYTADAFEVVSGTADAAAGRLQFSGRWQHAAREWSSGTLAFNVSAAGVSLERIAHVRDLGGALGGKAELTASGTARAGKQRFDLEALRGSLTVRDATVNGKPAGSLSLAADTSGAVLKVTAEGNLREAQVRANGEWKLEGNYPGHAQITFAPVSIAALDGILSAARSEPARDLPFRGTVSGSATVTGPLGDGSQLRGEVRLEQVRMTPNPDVQGHAGAAPPDVTLQNASPVLFDVTRTGADIREARFVANETELEARGRVGFGAQNPWNVVVTGSINLRILQLFNSDLLASGHSTLRAAIRGSLDNPQVDGRLELQNASLYLADLPNGVDKANGVILFDRTRATIQTLSAESGGGRISFTGFVGFGAPVLTYRVAARADGVRYRSPQGASITMDAVLDLTGTSKSSMVSGTVTVNKASFNPGTDIGSLLAQAARPVSTPATPNQYFQGLQFDIRIRSARNLEVQTSLARGLQGQADLRITGTPQRPVVLGNVSVNEGLIGFFGNRYTINRGEVHFDNALKIEPVVDLDLETRERGITVDIMLSGPLTKLNLSYRSDPPLKSEQIVALLTVGRTPSAPGELTSTQASGQTGLLANGSNALLQQAITAPGSGRLERLFGVSHIKIDPELSDITTVPQAHLSMEQQIQRDVTLTYTTNLARTQEQLIQIEWDLSRKWSVVAVRDENGFFGIDFQYRKRF
jgi:translocation and assembly module TamB